MDGFGRELLDQYYKAGSSLEVMCAVDRLPARPLPDIVEWRHGDRVLPLRNTTLGQRSVGRPAQDQTRDLVAKILWIVAKFQSAVDKHCYEFLQPSMRF